MELNDLLSAETILPNLKVNSKKQLLQELADKAAELNLLAKRDIFEALLQRERLGSTGVGNGIAIPHGKLQGLDRLVGIFAQLESPIAFDAIDDQPVDLVFLILAPEGSGADHLRILSKVSRVLRNDEIVQKIRSTKDASAIYSFLIDEETSHAA
jgi:PTS system nitrogen regulatory IIA component